MTRERLLRYAQLTGGMFGQAMTQSTGQLFTLDCVRWTGNTYTFTYNVQDYIFHYKQIFKLPAIVGICTTAMEYALEIEPSAQTPAAFNMAYKLHELIKKSHSRKIEQ